MKKAKKLIIVLLILFLAIIIGTLIYIYNNMDRLELASSMTLNINGKTEKNQLLLSGVGVFSEKYTGKIKTTEITQKLQELTKQDIPDLYKEVKNYKDSKLQKYYEENSSDIKEKFGIQTADEFVEFIKGIKESNINLKTWYKLNVKSDTFIEKSEKSGYSYVEYDVSYGEDEEKITFALYIAERNITPMYIIDIVK